VEYSPTALNNSGGAQSMAPTGRLSLELMLNRIPDVTIPIGDYDIPGKNDGQDIKDIRQRGTMYDIDYLYRAANGVWMMPDAIEATNKRDDKKKKGDKKKKKEPDYVGQGKGWPYESGDIGMLLPTSMWLSIGKSMRYYGWVESISYTHELFSSDMIPILTRVGLSFQRLLIGSEKDFEALTESSAVSRNSYGEYFDVGAAVGASAPAPGSSPGAKGYPNKKGSESNPQYAWFSLLNDGYSKAAAAGVLGNLEEESGIDPNAVQDGGPGQGIAQWSEGERWDELVDWCSKKNYNPRSMQGQVGFMLFEMESDWGNFNHKSYAKENDPADAAFIFHRDFEVSADGRSQIQERLDAAKRWYKKFKDLENAQKDTSGVSRGWSAGNRVHVVGDSLTVGSESGIKSRYRNRGVQISVDAKTGRTTSDAVSLFDDGNAREADTLIIALGTNDYWDAGAFKSSARRILQKINSSVQVFWINVRLQNHLSASRDINDALSDLSRDFGNLYIIDYYSRVESRYFAGDGIHLTGAGYQWRTGLYVKSVVGGSVSDRVGT